MTVRTGHSTATAPHDRPFAVQIYGSTDEMVPGAQWVEAYGATIIDINMGCPVRKVVKGGGGSAMMCDTTGATIDLVAKVVEAVCIPVTVYEQTHAEPGPDPPSSVPRCDDRDRGMRALRS